MGRRVDRSREGVGGRRRGRLRWLGLGALGLAAAALLGGRRRRRPPPRPAPQEPERVAAPRLELPDDAEASWIPGPAGTVRIVERHRRGAVPIVFVHGLGGCADQWCAQMADAGPAIHAVALDLPGHGGSDPPDDGDLSLPALASAIGAVLDGLRLRAAVLVGHSLGASAAIEYAGSHGGRVAGLLLVDPSGDQTRIAESQRRRLLEQLERDPAGEVTWYFRQLLIGARPEVAERVLEHLAATPTEVVLGAFEGAQAYSPVGALRRFSGPVTSVISDLNTLPYSLHNLLPDLPVRRLGGASHWLMLDRPDELWGILVDFLDALAGAKNGVPAYC